MATGGIRILFAFPILIALFILGISQIRDNAEFTRFIGTQPDQVVYLFLNALNRHDVDAASALTDHAITKSELTSLAIQLQENYGSVVISSTEIGKISADHAIIWSDTATANDLRYIIDWPLERRYDQWLITNFSSLSNMLADWHGI